MSNLVALVPLVIFLVLALAVSLVVRRRTHAGGRRLREGVLHRQPRSRRVRARHDDDRHLRLGELVCGRARAGVARWLGLGLHGGRAGHGPRFALRYPGEEDGARFAQARRRHRDRRHPRALLLECARQRERGRGRALLRGDHGRASLWAARNYSRPSPGTRIWWGSCSSASRSCCSPPSAVFAGLR